MNRLSCCLLFISLFALTVKASSDQLSRIMGMMYQQELPELPTCVREKIMPVTQKIKNFDFSYQIGVLQYSTILSQCLKQSSSGPSKIKYMFSCLCKASINAFVKNTAAPSSTFSQTMEMLEKANVHIQDENLIRVPLFVSMQLT